MRSEHGGDLYQAKQYCQGEILDFSVNLNPLGAPDSVLRAAAEAALHPEAYPDPDCRELRKALGALHGVPEDWILCGNGASELIYRLAQALRPEQALLASPSFSEYGEALESVGCACTRFELKEEHQFDLTPDFLTEITPGQQLVLLCTPNNPTGRQIPPVLLREILERCRDAGAVLAVDECFLPLAEGGEGSLAPLLGDDPELLLFRAFTKSYAIPGLRLGYCLCSSGELLEKMERCGPCWNVSGPAQAAGLACCEEPDWPARGREVLSRERPYLRSSLERLGLEVIPGAANFLLFRSRGDSTLKERLLSRGILIRSCGNFRGLGPDWYRTAVRSHEDNQRLVSAMEGCLSCQK